MREQGLKHTMAKDDHNQAKTRSANLPLKVDVRSVRTPDGGQKSGEACASPTQRSKELFDHLVQRITSPGLKQLLSPGHVSALFSSTSCCKPETSTDACSQRLQRGASPAPSSKPPPPFQLGSASLRQRPRSTTPTSGFGSKSSSFEPASQIAHRVLSDPNAAAVSPSPSTTPPGSAKLQRPRITSRLNSRDGPSSPIDEQELVDLSLDVDPDVTGDETEDEGGASSDASRRSPTPLPARSPPQIVNMLSPADAAQLKGPALSSRLSPLLLRLPVRLRSMLSPAPPEMVGGQSSPFYRFDRPEPSTPQGTQAPAQPAAPATQHPSFHSRPPVRPAHVGLRPYCITHTVAPRRPFAPPTSSNSLQSMRTLRSPAPNPILAKISKKPVPGSVSRVDTGRAAGLATVFLGLAHATVAGMLSMASWKGGGTWWAGLTCVIAGLLSLQTPTVRPLTIARPEAATIAGVLASMTLVVGLLLSMAHLNLLRQATVCGSPNTVLRDYSYQGGTGTQTLGAACGFSSGCSCVPLAALLGTQGGDLTCNTVAFQPHFIGCGATQHLLTGLGLASVGLQVVLLTLVVMVLSTRRRPAGHNVGGLFVGWDREKRMRRGHSQPWAVVTPAPNSPSTTQEDREEIEEEEIISIAAY